MKVPKYIGESSRSAYERGWEHLDKLASLSSKSMMLKHLLSEHEDQDMADVQWGMFVTSFKRSAFERQLEEAVLIDNEYRSNHKILNSRAEWNNSALPRLVAKIGTTEDELKACEKEIKKEKLIEEEFEKKVRGLRKERNKARLQPDRNHPAKRQKTEESNNYISIRSTWGPPPTSAPAKNSSEQNDQPDQHERKRLRTSEPIEKLSTAPTEQDDQFSRAPAVLEDREEAESDGSKTVKVANVIYEKESTWEEQIKNYEKILIEETLMKESEIPENEIQESSWQLFNECVIFLEENEKDWKKKKDEREIEKKKIERLSVAKNKQDALRAKIKERKLNNEITENLNQLPTSVKKKITIEEQNIRKKKLEEIKKNLWTLRRKEKKYQRKSELVEQLERIEKKEEKLKVIQEALTKLREEEKKFEEEKKQREEKKLQDWRKKVKEKEKREKDKKEKLEKQRLLSQRWAMQKWITNFIKENQEKWNREREETEKRIKAELEAWEKMKRLEKIAYLKRKWENKEIVDNTEQEIEIKTQTKIAEYIGQWTVWRRRDLNAEPEIEKEREKEEDYISTIKYSAENLIKEPTIQPTTETIPEFEQEVDQQTKEKSLDYAISEQEITKNKTTTILIPPKDSDKPSSKRKDNNKNNKTNNKKTKSSTDNKERKITSMFQVLRKGEKENKERIRSEDNTQSLATVQSYRGDVQTPDLSNMAARDIRYTLSHSIKSFPKPDLAQNQITLSPSFNKQFGGEN